jgi:hypothetical protein
MIKILKGNCEQMALLESMLMGTGWLMKVEPTHTNIPLYELQDKFRSVVFVNAYELQAHHGLIPVRLRFEYNINENRACIMTSRKGIDRLKEIFPETFERINMSLDDNKKEEVTLEVKPFSKLKPSQA